jgi:hypothetical protein
MAILVITFSRAAITPNALDQPYTSLNIAHNPNLGLTVALVGEWLRRHYPGGTPENVLL